VAFPSILHRLPKVRGKLRENVVLAPYTWFRVGGAAQVLFMPEDTADLALFLAGTPLDIPVQVLGVASNTLVRDGGVPGVTIRLGPAFAEIKHYDNFYIGAGAACLDAKLSKVAGAYSIGGLEFYSGIPGTIGGALRMNAGCYGRETKDVLYKVIALDRRGRQQIMSVKEMEYSYRNSNAPMDLIFIEATFKGYERSPALIFTEMANIKKERELSQPIREKTGGSTFKNPDPKLSGGRSAWKLIHDAGGRGLKIGGALMSEKHCNFMINHQNASAADLELLGETIRKKVMDSEGVDLSWEIRRIGNGTESEPRYE